MPVIFHLDHEKIVQVDDKTRLDASKSSVAPGTNAIRKVEIRPEASEVFYNTGTKGVLDWAYGTSGVKTITIRVTTGVSDTVLDPPVDKTYQVKVLTASEDRLFSSDADLMAHEDDILKWVREGRNTFLDKHRAAQEYILSELDKRSIVDRYGNKITKDHIYDITEVKEWSKFYTLYLIFRGISNAVGDVFAEKAMHYLGRAKESEKYALIRLDLNGDGNIDSSEQLDIFSTTLVKR